MTIPHTPADKTPEELAQFFDNNGLPNLGKTARVLDSMRQAHTPAEPEPGESKSVSRTTYQMTGKITSVRKGRPDSADHSDEVELDPAPAEPEICRVCGLPGHQGFCFESITGGDGNLEFTPKYQSVSTSKPTKSTVEQYKPEFDPASAAQGRFVPNNWPGFAWELDFYGAALLPHQRQGILSAHEATCAQREAQAVRAGKHEQRHQALGVSRWIAVGEEHGYWEHPMAARKIKELEE
jgi:hypothetical protein